MSGRYEGLDPDVTILNYAQLLADGKLDPPDDFDMDQYMSELAERRSTPHPDIDLNLDPKVRKRAKKYLRKKYGPPTRWQRFVAKIRSKK